MPYVADLHIHSRFARACSPQLNIPTLTEWAKYKGINVIGTGDFLHPIWQEELKNDLTEDGTGFLVHKDSEIKFVLTVEIATMYTHKGRGRRIHNLIFLPDFASVDKFQKLLLSKKANLSSDGRPIIGMSSKDLLYLALEASEKVILIPAHCVLPDTMVHTIKGLQRIQDIMVGDLVYTHNNRKREVTEVIKHEHNGILYKIQPWYFSPGLEATEEHPFYGFHIKYCPTTGNRCLPTVSHKKICKHKLYEQYSPDWILTKDLKEGDILAFPRFNNTTPIQSLYLDRELPYKAVSNLIKTGGSRGHIFDNNIVINEDFCRLVGYYLAEGSLSITKGHISFASNQKEVNYLDDVKELIGRVFGIKHVRIYSRLNNKGVEIIVSSKLLSELFAKLFYVKGDHKAFNKSLPDWVLHLPERLQAQLLLGWWRGDHGYTTSRSLMNNMKVICLRLGIIPSIGIETLEDHLKRGEHQYKGRAIKATADLYYFSRLAFFNDTYNLLSDPSFKESKRKLDRRHGWIDENYAYLPIRKISTREHEGEVFNLEVNEDNSYVTEFATVHNCWTPWFGVFGSKSGYDSLQECFEDLTDYVYGIETGLSSDPLMNWRVNELDKKSILSFSDAHSLPNLGREVTVFNEDLKQGYLGLFEAIKQQKVASTIEFYPEEGKYHYTGHRSCNIKYTPQDSKTKGTICPVCHKGLTVGVMERIEEVAERTNGQLKIENEKGIIKSTNFPTRPGYRMLVPLQQVIAESFGTSIASKKVFFEYKKLVIALGSEIEVLTTASIAQIANISGERIAEGVQKVRIGDLVIDPGFDGVYGVVKIWNTVPQPGLFE